MKKRGFTLIELMIVVAIIGILAAIAIPDFLKFQAKARQSEAKTNLASVATSQIAYFAEHNNWGESFNRVGWAPQGSAKYKYTLSPGMAQGTCEGLTDMTTDCYWGNVTCNNGPCAGTCTYNGGAPGVVNPSGFTAVAEGNIDSDTTTDCWGIDRQKMPQVMPSRNDVND